MASDKLSTYRRKRDPGRTPEPVPPAGPLPEGNDDTFVIQEHHARRLHWDVRLERDGVLVSWAVPRGLPLDPKTNHLAVHTEDHPLEYASFSGEIPRGEYGGGTVILWDRGRYELEKWTDREVKVVFHGSRATGRYVFFRTRGRDWMVHRMEPPPDPDWRPIPAGLRPMKPVPGDLPDRTEDRGWAYEMAWRGIRALVLVEGGRARAEVDGVDVTGTFPELRGLGPALGSRVCVLDGEIVALNSEARPDPDRLRRRRAATGETRIRRLAEAEPVTFLAMDVLHLDGHDTTGLSYRDRRELLDRLPLAAPRWGTSPLLDGSGSDALTASRELGLGAILAKRLDSEYRPGRRSPAWRLVDNRATEDVVIGGWLPAPGAPELPGVLLVGTTVDGRLRYAGTVRAGVTGERREELGRRLARLARKTSPFGADGPDEPTARWVRPTLAGRVATAGRTSAGRFRRPVWKGLSSPRG